MIILETYLDDPVKNKALVDALHEIDRRLDEIKLIDSTPQVNTERSAIMYDRKSKNVLICDTTEWRSIATEEVKL